MDIALPLDQMSVEEKLRAIETLWNSLCRDPETVPSPAWHEQVLRERAERVRSGQEKPIPWEEAKRDLRDRLS